MLLRSAVSYWIRTLNDDVLLVWFFLFSSYVLAYVSSDLPIQHVTGDVLGAAAATAEIVFDVRRAPPRAVTKFVVARRQPKSASASDSGCRYRRCGRRPPSWTPVCRVGRRLRQ